MEFSDLKKIGLTEGEIKIYSALLDLGESTRTEIAKKSGVSPSKIYDVANRLIEKGLVSHVKKHGVIHFSAANPERIKNFINKKEDEIKKEKELAENLLPMLLAKYEKTEEETDIEVYYGWEGMETAYDGIIKTLEKEEFNYIFGASQGIDSKRADLFFSRFYHKKRKKGFGSKIIFNEEVRKNKQRTSLFLEKPNEMRFLHNNTFSEINLYRNIVLFVMLLKKPIVIKVKNQEAADSFKAFFDTMWELAKK